MTSKPNTARILIADDHRLFNDAVTGLLSSAYAFVRQVFDGNSLVYAIQLEKPDLLLLDINLTNLNGLEIAQKLRKDYPDIKIIVVTMYNQIYIIEAVQALGLEGYVLKDSPSQLLMDAIEKVLAGHFFFDPNLHKKVPMKDDFSNHLLLTKREKQVMEKLISGQKSEEIARELGLAYETIKTYRKNIYLKLEVNSIAELIHKVRDWNNDISLK